MAESTWKPHKTTSHGRLSASIKKSLPDSVFAFPSKRKEPMTDATHVRDAMARFNQVKDVNDAERDLAFINIKKAADYFKIEMKEKNWHEFGMKHI